MKINELRLKNFKVFLDERFNFRKITLLTGANSAGKSTVLNALASIVQGNDSTPYPFFFNANGDNVNLGQYKDIVTNGNTSNTVEVSVKFSKNSREDIALKGVYRYASAGKQTLVDELSIKSSFGKLDVKWFGQDTGYKAFRQLSEKAYGMNDIIYKVLLSIPDKLSDLDINPDDFSKENINSFIRDIGTSSVEWEDIGLKKSNEIYSFLREKTKYSNLLKEYNTSFDSLLEQTAYVGPIRPHPERQYLSKPIYGKINSYGTNAFQYLIDWYSTDTQKFKKVVSDLKLIGLADDVEANRISDDSVEFLVKPLGHKNKVNISDVGFGVSQILPVVVANILQKKNSSLLINQPEVHLHPSSQAQLANYFFEESRNKNLVIETHSEYLINRFRLLVAKGELKPSDINIIFISNSENENLVSNIEIAENGSLVGAPSSFFDTYYIDNEALVFSSLGFGND
ncbi:AAA family ATPase [Vibrio parahaemolyticus]|uniref:AAA family ATPase n=1 Tax=Vibrio parahaemolyticus TaxID=670 RepID=UPI0013E931D2|nr:AAA family ATPase [Vibrio parahaemolyticus]ELN6869758.1 AAA family ATPase [Vibrio parahaemolyticus]MDF5206769.1 AAA family ATPase [Vibrio parahaemolyticus]MDF5216747.1 AAA family ATPase [Vibrio parahaemolyticus]HBC3415657.1 AAA family ATPase [Vibrio parahaemolyticus]HBC3600804.1 AAA family ATPase [Vibrio parahaemolyticus]